MNKISFLVIILLTISFTEIALAEPSTPLPVIYDIRTFGSLPQDCSAEFTNLRNNQTKTAICESCGCLEDLANLNSQKGDIISVDLCIYNETVCRNDKFDILPDLKVWDS